MTAAKLGTVVGISESTVVRFAYELGFDGYPELSKALQQTIKTRLTSVQRIEATKDRIGENEVIEKVLAADADKIKRTIEQVSRADFKEAAKLLAGARNIYIIGDRSASALARFMTYYLNLMFDNVRLIHPYSASELYEQLLQLSSEDVLVGISFPRYSAITVQAFEFAVSSGAKVVAITDGPASPLAKDATCLLTACSDMTSFVDSLVAPMSLINALIVAVGLEKPDEVTASFDRLEKIWAEYNVYQGNEED